ncbi:MAG: thiosulfate oxidation carrier protein SoxY [Rhodocyclales bacterium GT-UBC]|nr:MAG: thiosulfate oxidation carrier protein SoxY [Rhodocyclales bacterium GT-UBC]
MQALRRKLLKGGASTALLAPFIGSGLLSPKALLAAEWQRGAFSARSVTEALKAHGSSVAQETRDIVITAPEIAENGAKVEVDISCSLPGAKSLAVFADKNPLPLCASIDFLPPALPFARIQLKLAETTRIRAVIRTADGKNHVAFREVKVTLGGCGG